MRILLWHVHGSWTTAFVQGGHDYLVPVLPDRGPDGVGRARTWDWPSSVVELSPQQLRHAEIDLVVLQRPVDARLVEEWTGRTPGRELPALYLEHNTPEGPAADSRHPFADQADVPIVHVTHFNHLMWDNGRAPTTVIEHGVVDPGQRYTGELARAAVVVNDPVRRGRSVGTDIALRVAGEAPLDVFGMIDGELPGTRRLGDVPQAQMHQELARRRVYVHPMRWTSLGLSLIEAMHLGMPVVVTATTEAVRAVPPEAGVVSADIDELVAGVHTYLGDVHAAHAAGQAARAWALQRYGLDRFRDEWDLLMKEVVG